MRPLRPGAEVHPAGASDRNTLELIALKPDCVYGYRIDRSDLRHPDIFGKEMINLLPQLLHSLRNVLMRLAALLLEGFSDKANVVSPDSGTDLLYLARAVGAISGTRS
jgi:hypothetical protein